MLLLRKQIGALLIISVLSVSFVLFINVFSDWINHSVPVAIARPLQWMLVSKSKEAEASIESSSRWREELFKMSIAEWRSNPRIFWFGRATYGYGVNDYVAQQLLGGFEAGKESSLRRGVTHNLLTDLLVMYGLVGCIFYYCLVLAIIWFLWIAYRSPTVPSLLKPLGLICLITFAAYPITATIAGELYSPELMWLLIVFVAALYQYEPLSSEPKETSALLPEPVPRRLAQLAK
jgi:O-antigen ligase